MGSEFEGNRASSSRVTTSAAAKHPAVHQRHHSSLATVEGTDHHIARLARFHRPRDAGDAGHSDTTCPTTAGSVPLCSVLPERVDGRAKQATDARAEDGAAVIHRDDLPQVVHKLIERRAWRPRAEPVGDFPAELRDAGLPTLCWFALSAAKRHYLKRRIGKYKAEKLLFGAFAFVAYDLLTELRRDDSEISMSNVKDAMEQTGIIPWTIVEHHEHQWRTCCCDAL